MTTEQLKEHIRVYDKVKVFYEEENSSGKAEIFLKDYMELMLETIISKIKNSD